MIRIGVVGLGFGQLHVKTLATMDNVQLVGVADSSFKHPGGLVAFAKKYGAKPYEHGEEMIRSGKLDALSICTSPRSRKGLIEAAAAADVPMLVEKPWATNMTHARVLSEICQKYGTLVMPAFSFRFHPAIVSLRSLLAGELGAPRMLSGEYVFNILPPKGAWLWDPQNGNGFINENSVHLFDSVCSLLGDPESVFALGGNFSGSPSEDSAVVSMRFKNGSMASLTCGGIGSGNMKDYPTIHLLTEHGEARLHGREHIWESVSWGLKGKAGLNVLNQSPEILNHTRYSDAMRHFVDCVENNRPPAVTVHDAMVSTAIAM